MPYQKLPKYSRCFSSSIHRGVKKVFYLYWLRVRLSYHRFNILSELLNGDLAAKIGWGVLLRYLMDREYYCSLPYKVNRSMSTKVNSGNMLNLQSKMLDL